MPTYMGAAFRDVGTGTPEWRMALGGICPAEKPQTLPLPQQLLDSWGRKGVGGKNQVGGVGIFLLRLLPHVVSLFGGPCP